MKKNLALIVIVIAAFATIIACNNLHEPSVPDTLTPSLTITDCAEGQRAMAQLTVLPEEYPYTANRPLCLEYTIDNGLSTIIRVFGGKLAPMDEAEWQNLENSVRPFRTGDELWFSLWNNYVPTCYFLMPQLKKGTHIITIQLKDLNGDYSSFATVSATWTVNE